MFLNSKFYYFMFKCWFQLKPVLGGVDGNLHFPVPSMNRLNQTEPATFSILPCWAFFRDSVFIYFIKQTKIWIDRTYASGSETLQKSHSLINFVKKKTIFMINENMFSSQIETYFSLTSGLSLFLWGINHTTAVRNKVNNQHAGVIYIRVWQLNAIFLQIKYLHSSCGFHEICQNFYYAIGPL
jgi:hypothetical protein